jgi:hypothetical protein
VRRIAVYVADLAVLKMHADAAAAGAHVAGCSFDLRRHRDHLTGSGGLSSFR